MAIVKLDRPIASAARRELDRVPAVLLATYRLRYRHSPFLRRIVGPHTKIVIEGFPRSGNSFANRAFQYANPTSVDAIATHLHLSSQVVQGAQLALPTIVVFRDPAECIPSLYALRRPLHPTLDDPATFDSWLRDYIAFSRRVLRVSDDVVVVPFSQLTTDFGVVLDVVNERFSASFNRFEHTAEMVEAVFETSGSHLSPSVARSDYKQRGKEIYLRSSAGLRAEAARELQALHDAVLPLLRTKGV